MDVKRNFDFALRETGGWEGGYSDHDQDPGGKTMYGITQATLKKWRKSNPGDMDVRKLTKQEAEKIYHQWYWLPVKGDELPDGGDFAVFDMAVNAGPERAIKTLQRAVGVRDDGILGPRTLAAVRAADKKALIAQFNALRLNHMKRLRHWPTFKNGWTRRVLGVTQEATRLASL